MPLMNHDEPRFNFLRYEKNIDDAAIIYDAVKLPLNLVHGVNDPELKVHLFNNFFSKTLEEHLKR